MRIVREAFWWTLTLLTLFLLDDMVVGPLYWLLALIDPVFSTVVAFVLSAAVQFWMLRELLKVEPSKLASFLLQRLMPTRKTEEIATRERVIGRKAASVAGAVLVTPLIGAVIPITVLNQRKLVDAWTLRCLSVLLVAVYSTEFALIHGGFGLGALMRAIFHQP